MKNRMLVLLSVLSLLVIFSVVYFTIFQNTQITRIATSSIDPGYKVLIDNGEIENVNRKLNYDGKEFVLRSTYSDGIRLFVELLFPEKINLEASANPNLFYMKKSNGLVKHFDSVEIINDNNTNGYRFIDQDFNDFNGGNYSLCKEDFHGKKLWKSDINIQPAEVKIIKPKKSFEEVYFDKISVGKATIELEGKFLEDISFDKIIIKQASSSIHAISIDITKSKGSILFKAMLPCGFDINKKFDMIFYGSDKQQNNAVIQVLLSYKVER